MQQQVTDTGEADEVQNSPETAGGTEGDSSDTTQPSDNNSQPTQSAPRQASAAPTPSKAGCNWYSDVPYNTVNTPDSSMHEGQTKTVGGVNGSRKVCTDAKGNVISNEVTYPAVDMVVYYGTYTRDQALSDSRAACRSKGLYEGSTDFSDCVSSEMRKRGF